MSYIWLRYQESIQWFWEDTLYLGTWTHELYMASISGIKTVALGRYSVFGYLDPYRVGLARQPVPRETTLPLRTRSPKERQTRQGSVSPVNVWLLLNLIVRRFQNMPGTAQLQGLITQPNQGPYVSAYSQEARRAGFWDCGVRFWV